MDKISINGLRVFAYHGVNPEEKVNGQNFEIDIDVYRDLRKAGTTDDISDTISYAKVAKLAVNVMQKDSFDLIEKAAASVARAILNEFDSAHSVRVKLKKPEAPINLEFNYMAVEIFRVRGE